MNRIPADYSHTSRAIKGRHVNQKALEKEDEEG
jgi:hypothetical protein